VSFYVVFQYDLSFIYVYVCAFDNTCMVLLQILRSDVSSHIDVHVLERMILFVNVSCIFLQDIYIYFLSTVAFLKLITLTKLTNN